MRWRALVLLSSFLLATVAVLATASPCWACSCLAGTDEGSFTSSDVVFIGTAIESRRSPLVPNFDLDPWTFDVESVQKGPASSRFSVDTESAHLTTLHGGKAGLSSSSCGFRLQIGHRYQIFAKRKESGLLTTGLCSASRELTAVGSLPDLSRAQAARPYWPDGGWVAAAAIAAGAVLGLATALALRRRISS